MTFRQLLKRVVPADAQTRVHFDMGIRVLLFVQGGYDVERRDWWNTAGSRDLDRRE